MSVDVSIPENLGKPNWGPMGEDIYNRTYSRTKKDGSRETWAETVKRVVDGNGNFVGKQFLERGEPEKLFELIYNFALLPGGRHLWSTGVTGREYISNCWTSGWHEENFSRHFCFAFSRLMEGGGVGSNYSNSYFRHYKPIPLSVKLHVVCDKSHKDYPAFEKLLSEKYSPDWAGCVQVDDSKEGWVKSLETVINAHFGAVPGFEEGELVVDVSKVRASGSKLKSFGGTASGPAALVEMLHNVNSLMNAHKDKKPDCWLALNMDHEIARCVVAGNVRRSARMSMKHWKDEDIFEFIRLKGKDGTSHWTTNISVIVDSSFFKDLRHKDAYAKKLLKEIVEGMLHNGEPGIFNITKASEGELCDVFSTNPCGEIILPEFGSCNLGAINLSYFANRPVSELLEAFRLMTRFLIRATFAPYPDSVAQDVVRRDRRIGVGLTGFADWQILEGHTYSHFPNCEGQKNKLQLAADMVRKEARRYAYFLRIPEPVKVTTAAPTGTTSKLCGVSEGIQPILFKYFKRRVNFSMNDEDQKESVARLKKEGYEVEDSVYTPHTKVVSYICAADILNRPDVDFSKVEDSTEISLDECLAVQKTVQNIFVDNSVSFTINVDTNVVTHKDLESAILAFGPDLKGTTVMPTVSDRPQMPYEKISKEAFEAAQKKHSYSGHVECKNNVCQLILKTAEDDGSI